MDFPTREFPLSLAKCIWNSWQNFPWDEWNIWKERLGWPTSLSETNKRDCGCQSPYCLWNYFPGLHWLWNSPRSWWHFQYISTDTLEAFLKYHYYSKFLQHLFLSVCKPWLPYHNLLEFHLYLQGRNAGELPPDFMYPMHWRQCSVGDKF